MFGAVALAQVDASGPPLAGFDADLRDPVMTARAGRAAAGRAWAGASVGYGRRVLLAGEHDATVDALYALHVGGGWRPHARLRLDAIAPIVVYDARGDGVRVPDGYGAALADARAQAEWTILRPDAQDEGVALGLGAHLDLPTGFGPPGFGRRAVAGGVDLRLSSTRGPLTGALQVAGQLQPAVADTWAVWGPGASVGVATSVLVDDGFAIGTELIGRWVDHPAPGTRPVAAEALLTARSDATGGGHLFAAVGVGGGAVAGTPTLRVLLGGGLARDRSPPDRDGDGVPDASDRCPHASESPNGFRDDDGCADRLPTLRVWATLDDGPVQGAQMQLDGPATRRWLAGEQPLALEAEPDTVWRARAALGDCLAGEAYLLLGDDDASLQVPLRPVTHAQLRVAVQVPEGVDPSEVTLLVRSEGRGCSPSGTLRLPDTGPLTLPVGPGVHTLTAELGMMTSQTTYSPRRGEIADITLVLPQEAP